MFPSHTHPSFYYSYTTKQYGRVNGEEKNNKLTIFSDNKNDLPYFTLSKFKLELCFVWIKRLTFMTSKAKTREFEDLSANNVKWH